MTKSRYRSQPLLVRQRRGVPLWALPILMAPAIGLAAYIAAPAAEPHAAAANRSASAKVVVPTSQHADVPQAPQARVDEDKPVMAVMAPPVQTPPKVQPTPAPVVYEAPAAPVEVVDDALNATEVGRDQSA